MLSRTILRSLVRAPVQRVAGIRTFSLFLETPEATQRIYDVLNRFEKIDKSKITSTAHFNKDLGLDSLDAVEVVLAIEDEFNIEISDEQSDKIQSVDDAIKFIISNPNAK